MKRVLFLTLAVALALFLALRAEQSSASAASASASGPGVSASSTPAAAQESGTETVVSTFHVRPGKEQDFLDAMKGNWPELRRLGLVLAEPHLFLRGTEDAGKPVFVEVLTWVDHDAADNAPPQIQKVWARLQADCEPRDGRPGIEIPEFQVVAPQP
jgi:hypothetical protein